MALFTSVCGAYYFKFYKPRNELAGHEKNGLELVNDIKSNLANVNTVPDKLLKLEKVVISDFSDLKEKRNNLADYLDTKEEK
ncbi:hypothetical protein [Thalassotalea sp. ND16A]|uniref:hypothetical protein n=1 Tax=Thalassotalea sp. ND16A TaxID=1535422 RepID=UPI00051A0F8B|nr:hypothetical protein [Thalassotalea sp. ND16A]KGJ88104.1 hypothetical protein ND16A_2657 [Thalassotalea sp. ND16A]